MNGDIKSDSVSVVSQKLGELQFEEEEEDAYYNKVINFSYLYIDII